ncbi:MULTISPECIES: Crp/Fnr family transcriptional regulator [Rhodopseudomonas]|uniref:Crp/Fnr family transcriptional regulator n=1 Tax=Rhodopseudomonas TaxID=1073 RepID=UPI000DF3548C|nr:MULTISPECIES: Crp/Fnr family transcriptional regulator [Rhodopseudomonas]
MVLQAAKSAADSTSTLGPARVGTGRSLLLTESHQPTAGPPSLIDRLSLRERELVLRQGRRKVLNRGQTLFSQGARHDGIFLIESGRIRVFYTSPQGREITLAYWHIGNFVGGPEVFDTGVHQWSGVAATNAAVVHLPGRELRSLVAEVPNLAIGLIEGLSFKGKCYSALAQMLGTRSITQRLAHLLLQLVDLYGVDDADGKVIAVAFTHADIAHLVGATRQWVTISLRRMQEKRIVQTRRSQIVVCRPDILEEMRGHATD